MKKVLLIVCISLLAATTIHAQEKKEIQDQDQNKEQVKIRIKSTSGNEDSKPVVYVDGKLFEFDLDLIDPEKIESINVVKGEKAIEEYNAPDGVILINTKKAGEANKTKIRIRGTKSMDGDAAPMIIIDGKVRTDHDVLDQISPDDIESISVLKDEKAIEKYDAPNGVIIVTTKKGAKGKGRQ